LFSVDPAGPEHDSGVLKAGWRQIAIARDISLCYLFDGFSATLTPDSRDFKVFPIGSMMQGQTNMIKIPGT
jgi:hypothetical protein